MPNPLNYQPPQRDRRRGVSTGEWVLASLVAFAFAAAFVLVIWLLVLLASRGR